MNARSEKNIIMGEIINCRTTDLIFDIDPKTVEFIRKIHHGDVTVDMDFEPMLDSG